MADFLLSCFPATGRRVRFEMSAGYFPENVPGISYLFLLEEQQVIFRFGQISLQHFSHHIEYLR